jgi:long-chain fatty acid transport protein
VQATDQLMLVADYKRIGWKSVMQNFSMSFTSAAGNVNFVLPQNWSDQDVFEFGGAYRMSDALTLRAGVNIANNPVPNNLMNPLFPAIGKSHETVGASYAFNPVSSLHFNYVYMNKVTATNAQGVAVDFGGFSSQLLYSHKF